VVLAALHNQSHTMANHTAMMFLHMDSNYHNLTILQAAVAAIHMRSAAPGLMPAALDLLIPADR